VLFFASLGVPVALATPDGGLELPGSGAPTSGQLALELLPALAPPALTDVEVVPDPVEQAATMAVARAAVPRAPRDFVVFTGHPLRIDADRVRGRGESGSCR